MRPYDLGPDDLTGEPSVDVLERMARSLRDVRSALVTAHVSPDGDAIGSQFALVHALRSLGCRAFAVHVEEVPPKYVAFASPEVFVHASEEWLREPPEFDVAIVLDTSVPDRIGPLSSVVFRAGQRRMCLDHHLADPDDGWEERLVVRRAPSTATLVLALTDALGVTLDEEISRLLWLGLSTDTGWFRFSNTDPRALRDAARLLEVGRFDPETFFDQVYGSHSVARTKLLGEMLSSLRVSLEGRFVQGLVRRDDRERLGVSSDELEGFVDHLKTMRGARVVALVTEVAPEEFKVSLRGIGEADVERVARAFGGGGHRKAAGCRLAGALEGVEASLDAAVGSMLAE